MTNPKHDKQLTQSIEHGKIDLQPAMEVMMVDRKLIDSLHENLEDQQDCELMPPKRPLCPESHKDKTIS